MLLQTCLDPILDRLPAEHLVSLSTHCITSLLQMPNTKALSSLLQSGSEFYSQHGPFRVSGKKTNLTYAVPAAQRFSLEHTTKGFPLCVPLHVLSPLCSRCFAATVCEPVGQCRASAWTQHRNTGMGKSHQRQTKMGSICIYLAAFICETLYFIFISCSLVTKAPIALLSTCTEQQGIVYAWKTGAA